MSIAECMSDALAGNTKADGVELIRLVSFQSTAMRIVTRLLISTARRNGQSFSTDRFKVPLKFTETAWHSRIGRRPTFSNQQEARTNKMRDCVIKASCTKSWRGKKRKCTVNLFTNIPQTTESKHFRISLTQRSTRNAEIIRS